MGSILEELYFTYSAALRIESDCANTISNVENKLYKMLKGKKKQLFSDYECACSQYATLCAIAGFKNGFRMGFDLAREMSEL